MTTIRSRNHNLHVVNYADSQVLYDTNRVKTYACSSVEAALINGISPDMAKHNERLHPCDPKTIEEAQNRLRRLSELSESLAQSQGIVPMFSGHPAYLFLNLCDSCNLQCTYCYAESCGSGSTPHFMSANTARSGIDFLLRHAKSGERYAISFAGGEPLLNFKVLASAAVYALDRSRQLGVMLQLKILTNGTVMNPEILKFVSDNAVTLQISLDGPPEIHDQLRRTKNGRKSSKKVIETIDYLKRHNFTGFRIRSTLCHGNSDLSKIIGFFQKQGFNNFASRPIMTAKKNPYKLRKSDLRKITEYYDRMRAIVIARLKTGSCIDIPEEFSLFVEKLKIGMKTKRYCGAGRDMVVVTPDGKLYPCPILVGDTRFCTGSLEHGFRRSQAKVFPNLSVDEKSGCRRCWARNLCGGGCVSQAIRLNNDPERQDPLECAMIQAKIKGAIAIHQHQKAVLQ